MEHVPNTPTALDSMLENRRIRDANALDIQKRDDIQREIKQWQPVLEAIHAEVAAHANLGNLDKEIHGRISLELTKQRDDLQVEIDEKAKRLEAQKEEEKALEKKNTTLKEQVEHHETRIGILKEDAQKHEHLAKTAKEKHGELLNSQQTELTAGELRILEAKKSLEKTQQEEKGMLAHRQAEEIRLANKSRDLAIWTERLTKFAAEHGIKMTL